MALSFSEGSIGGDIERVAVEPLKAFYGTAADATLTATARERLKEPSGSNGFAIAPANTQNGHALLLINPHTSFYFRSELQVTSEEGLNVYGAATWGQFFIYQGFNEHLGWMHTSSGIDNVDFFSESIVKRNDRFYYRYGKALRPVRAAKVTLAYRTPAGTLASRTFTTYHTHHGPVIRDDHGRWISVALMQKPVEALSQSYLLTKATSYAAFMKVMEFKANSSNNTIYADRDGNIAYLHPQFIPRRNDRFDFTHPVDGSDPETDWQGLHALDEAPHLLNPANGWIMNTNNWPYSAAGSESPRREDYPKYMDTYGENPRGQHATLVLNNRKWFTLDGLRDAAFDPYLPAFAKVVPALVSAFDQLPADSPFRTTLADPMQVLSQWDYRWSVHSVATTLAVLWGDELWERAKQDAEEEGLSTYDALLSLVPIDQRMRVLEDITTRLRHDFGTWRVPWGHMNRFQRLTADIVQPFSDSGASLPVPFTSARWGSLASFGARRWPGTNKYYGTSGNSFVAMVEFGPKIRAKAVTAGGESGDPRSVHFSDQIERYADGALRDVYFYPDELKGHIERAYHPE
jgi:acyl-homoserine-lactone acylase